MNEDPRKELEQLEMLLTLDEDWFRRELDSAKRMIGENPNQPAPAPRKNAPAAAPVRNYANGYGQPQSRPAPVEPPMPKGKGIRGLVILASLEVLGILGLAAYWVLVLLR